MLPSKNRFARYLTEPADVDAVEDA